MTATYRAARHLAHSVVRCHPHNGNFDIVHVPLFIFPGGGARIFKHCSAL